MRKIITVLTILIFTLGLWNALIFGAQEAATEKGEIAKIDINVEYKQTSARSVTDRLNEFRTGGEAWVWNDNNDEKVPVTADAVT